MKNALLLSLFIVLAINNTFSQVKFNPKTGINLSNFTQHDDVLESSANVGFSAGMDLKLGGRLHFSPGLFYTSSATEVKKLNNIIIDDVIKFHTIEAPLSVGFNIINKEIFSVSLKTGIEGAYFANVSELEKINQDDIQRLNWGLLFGAGVDIHNFSIDIKYDLGRNSVFKEDISKNINPQYNRMHLYVGYVF